MKNAPLFLLFLLSIGWPCAMVWGCWLSDGWAAVLVRTGKVRGLVRTENACCVM